MYRIRARISSNTSIQCIGYVPGVVVTLPYSVYDTTNVRCSSNTSVQCIGYVPGVVVTLPFSV